ncbi:Hypothetical predicted protein [Lecanosticta acicola]|uniref:DUF6604 domain-containing protein n=1 Tax=Lecanosticta acicola TaxID=111012 RepID=A0AAI9ECN4_9PEZI|nr:Hypothetical predicted protein [Lecanosticta acicola]
MASSVSFTGRYARYKQGTDRLVEWLARKANQCCDITLIVRSLSRSSSQREKALKSIELSTAQTLLFAEAIAAVRPPVYVPSEVLDLVREVIRLRQLSADEHAADSIAQSQEISQSDHGHQHFIGVLRRILRLLELTQTTRPEFTEEKTAKAAGKKKGNKSGKRGNNANTTDLENVFECLDLEDTKFDADSGTATTASATHARINISHIEFKLEKQNEDLEFALWCHLEDLYSVRKLVHQTWIEYVQGKMSFDAASIITEAAFGLVRCADDEFGALNPLFDEYDKILVFLDVKRSDVMYFEEKVVLSFISHSTDYSPKRKQEWPSNALELLCPAAAHLMDLHLTNSARWDLNFKNHNTGNPMQPRSLYEEHYIPYHKFGEVILNSVGRFSFAWLSYEDSGRLDELVTQLGCLDRCRTWAVVSFAMYMDVFDILGPDNPTGLKLAKDSLAKFQTLLETQKVRQPRDVHSAVLKDLDRAARMMELETDGWDRGDCSSPAFFRQRSANLKSQNAFATGLERKLPVYAGATAFGMKAWMMRNRACHGSNERSLSLHCMAYLYKVARRIGLLSLDWQDMEFLIASQTEVGPLVPKLTSTCKVRQYTIAFEAVLGLNTKFNLRFNKKLTTNVFTGSLKYIQVGAKFIDEWLGCTRKRNGVSTGKMIEVLLHQMASEEAHEAGTSRSAKASQERETFTPQELLSIFKKSLIREEPLLNFEYYEFFLECEKVLTQIAGALKEKLPSHITALSQITWKILVDAEHYDSKGTLPASSWLHAAVGPLQQMISDHGKDFVKKAYDQSSGHIPKHLWPECGRPYSDLKALQKKMAEPLERAGTRVAYTGRLVSIHHPKLTTSDIKQLASSAQVPEGQVPHLPSYMIQEEDDDAEHESHDAGGDVEWKVWHPWDTKNAAAQSQVAREETE